MNETDVVKHLWVERPRESNISLQRLGTELGIYGFILEPMHVDDVFCDIQVCLWIALIKHHKEQVKPAHDGRAHSHISPE